MFRSAASKVMWVGRATVFMVGLSMILALVLGVASTALAGNLDPLKIGSLKNVATKTTALVGKVATGSAFVVKNPSGGSALDLSVGDPLADPSSKTVAPMNVDSQAVVENLNADKLDGKSDTDFYAAGSKVADSSHADQADSATNAQNANTLEGKTASEFANATHPHSGGDITSGTVAEARVDGTVTRDGEVMPIVKSNDGPNSGVDADTLDGQDSSLFATDSEVDAKTANVWGYVRGDGALVQSPSANIIQVTHPATGEYCVVTSIDYRTYLSPQVTLADPGGSTKIASVGTGWGSSCNPLYSETQTPIPVYIRTPSGTAADGAFSIFVPVPR